MKSLSSRASRLYRVSPIAGGPHGAFSLDADSGARLFNSLGGIVLEEWLKHALFPVHHCFRKWTTAAPDSQNEYRRVLKRAFFPKGHLIDDPANGQTTAIGTLGETLLRWIRSNQKLNRVLIEPPVPQTSANGDIDLVEIHEERPGRFYAMAWEVKATDGSAGDRNAKVYSQLDDYPNRLAFEATIIAERYHGPDVRLKAFLKNLSAYAFNKGPEVRYGAFVMFDKDVTPPNRFVPGLSQHPRGTRYGGQHVAVSLGISRFNEKRQELWREMHLQP